MKVKRLKTQKEMQDCQTNLPRKYENLTVGIDCPKASQCLPRLPFMKHSF